MDNIKIKNAELLDLILNDLKSLKTDVKDIKKDISRIKLDIFSNKAKQEKYKIVEAKESTSWFW